MLMRGTSIEYRRQSRKAIVAVLHPGTTDTPLEKPSLEPRALPEEVDFILANANRYLAHDPSRSDVLSVFAGLRPLVQEAGGTVTQLDGEKSLGSNALASNGLVHADVLERLRT